MAGAERQPPTIKIKIHNAHSNQDSQQKYRMTIQLSRHWPAQFCSNEFYEQYRKELFDDRNALTASQKNVKDFLLNNRHGLYPALSYWALKHAYHIRLYTPRKICIIRSDQTTWDEIGVLEFINEMFKLGITKDSAANIAVYVSRFSNDSVMRHQHAPFITRLSEMYPHSSLLHVYTFSHDEYDVRRVA